MLASEKAPKVNLLDKDLILAELTEQKATFTEQELFYLVGVKASHCGVNALEAQAFAELILENESVISLSREEIYAPRYTTQEVLLTEKLMIDDARYLASQHSIVIQEHQALHAIQAAEKQLGFSFDKEQQAAIQYSLKSGNFCITQGSAGAGKTTLMLAVKIAYESKGLNIAGASIAKKASDNLLEETGIPSRTIASYIHLIENGQHPLRNIDVLVIDEAGLVPSTDLQALLYEARTSNCKLILTGEDRQLDAITKGGALRYLSRAEVIGTQRIETIRRQRQDWAREVVTQLRDGHSEKALDTLEEKGCLHWGETKDEAKAALIRDWHHYQKAHPDKQSLVLAQEWKDVKVLSEAIRNIHINEGKVGMENIPLECSVADKRFHYEFSVGDRIKFCRNDYRSLQVSNGTLGTIKQIESVEHDTKLTVEIDDNRTVSFLASEYSDEIGVNLCHAYALTVFSSQGTTVDGNTFILYSGQMDRANTYVALSRHKDESHLYVNKLEMTERAKIIKDTSMSNEELRRTALANLMKQDRYATLAIEHLEAMERSEPERHQEEELMR
ncbi:AAA family ATPase [Vibrio fluvialis]|nr:AAA family ATPase [Vibrio fluvialis]